MSCIISGEVSLDWRQNVNHEERMGPFGSRPEKQMWAQIRAEETELQRGGRSRSWGKDSKGQSWSPGDRRSLSLQHEPRWHAEQSDCLTGRLIGLGYVNEQWVTVPMGHELFVITLVDSVMTLAGQTAPPAWHTEAQQIPTDYNELVGETTTTAAVQ